ncbi:Leucine Rich repeats (2 copies) [Anatilimnocola aggregata]|uniref:Leucine Rich repeats (2 copies) n=1 Tax=Anatilimnocola aggregata TaxID=2528021 RepID=A0A517YF37_9BACT|nr:MauE/DoxX family redox-associated membrane protein [Anatilimnocola aggregata]QDU28762.1 Leucine Rich repeats (2 copies) [Anatilimnocola aggregata]
MARPRTTQRVNAHSEHVPGAFARWYQQVSRSVENYSLLLFVAVCQAATLLVSWPVWNVRAAPPLLPLIWFPEISFGIPLLLTLLAMVAWPRLGVAAHLTLLGIAMLADQLRLQPQVISLAVLMLGCVNERTAYLARWYLASMWLWAGLHKFLSPEWYGYQSWWFLEQCGFDGDTWHLPFAIAVALFETAVGLLAMFAPRLAVWPAVALHLGLLLLLSPLVRNFNESVWPWNLATAVAAYVLLRQSSVNRLNWKDSGWPTQLVIATLLFSPALFYVGLLNPHLAFVLYSGNMPRAIHISADSYHHLDGWTGLTVPFPDSPRLFIQHFERTAKPGERLHIADPRWGISDRYFIKSATGEAAEVSRAAYLPENGSVRVLELEDLQLLWQLRQAGYRLEPSGFEIITKATYSSPALASQRAEVVMLLTRLHNLQELHLQRQIVTDQDLRQLSVLRRLELVEMNRCQLPENALERLAELRALAWLDLEGSNFSCVGLRQLTARSNLQVLKIAHTNFSDDCAAQVSTDSKLQWLHINDTQVTSAGLLRLPVLPHCQWLSLAGNDIGNAALINLPQWPRLEILDLSRTKLTDDAIPTLSQLQSCQKIFLSGTQISSAGKARLRRALPDLNIDDEPVIEGPPN